MIPELLAPAGNLTKLKIALQYGADAVYFGGKSASLRSGAEFSIEELKPAIEYVHSFSENPSSQPSQRHCEKDTKCPTKQPPERAEHRSSATKKAYITANVYPHNRDLGFLREYITEAARANPDGLIISDLGVFDLCQKYAPNVPIHISTQANNTNYQSALKWHEMGAKRIILARELTLDEIKEYRENTPESLELEVFVHGAMCMGYSGRCLISNYLTGRDANSGSCAQPCRWEWNISPQPSQYCENGIWNPSSQPSQRHCEEGAPCPTWQPPERAEHQSSAFLKSGTHFIEVEQSNRGTFFFNSNDLCLIEHLNELSKIGINSIKIEGRNKSEYYVAAVTKAYRAALDDPQLTTNYYQLTTDLEKVSHRPYVYNFGQLTQNYGSSNYIRSSIVCGIVTTPSSLRQSRNKRKFALANFNNSCSLFVVHCSFYLLPCFQRGKILKEDNLEILIPAGPNITIENAQIFDTDLTLLQSTPHAEMPFYLKSPLPAPPGSFIRKNLTN